MTKAFFLTLAALLAAGFGIRAEPINGIKAVVHDSSVTHWEVGERMIPAITQLRSQYAAQPDVLRKKLEEAERDNLDHLVENQLILHEFKGFNVPETILDKDVDKRVDDIIRERYYGDRMRLIKSLQAEGITFEKFRQNIRDQFIEVALRQKNVSSEIIISPHKVESYYLAHREDYKIEDEVKFRMIVLTNSVDADAPPARKLAEELLSKLNEGANFADLAEIYSQGSRKEKGDSDWMQQKVLRKELAEAASSLKVGEHSGVIETHDPPAYYLMYMEDKRPAHYKSLGEVRDEIEKNLVLEEKSRLEKQWIAKLRKKTFVRYYY
jgi:peptidyl-prolyl cis-trans isomerase SurA